MIQESDRNTQMCSTFHVLYIMVCYTLQWRHNGHDNVSNHQPHDYLFNRLVRSGSNKTSTKLRATGFCEGNSPMTGEFPAHRARNAENVSIWWRHHDLVCLLLAHLNHVRLVIQQYLYRWICYPNSPEYVLLMSHGCHGPSGYPRLDCVFNCLFELTKKANETPHNWLFVRRYYTDDRWSLVKRTINYRTLSYGVTASCWLSRYIVHFKGYAVGTDLNSWMIYLYYMPFRCGMNIMNISWALQNHMTIIQNLQAFV